MKTSAISYAFLLALLSVSSAFAETDDECKNNTDVQKFIDGKCNVLKGYDLAPPPAKLRGQGTPTLVLPDRYPIYRQSPTDRRVQKKLQKLWERHHEVKKQEVQRELQPDKKDNSSKSVEQAKPVESDAPKK